MIVSKESKQTHKVLNCKTAANNSRLIEFDSSKSYNVIPEIRKLVEELANFQEVKKVQAIATNFPDLHWIDFQLELSEEDTDLPNEIWERIQDLVIDYEWKLIDDSSENWYFRPQIVNTFYSRKEQVIADSSEKQHKLVSSMKICSSSPHKFIVI